MRKNIAWIILALGIISGLGYAVCLSQKENQLSVGGVRFRVERADTPQKRELGLGQREALCDECAMLFVFPEREAHSFWMKGMRFPLDIIWFNSADGRIIYLEKNIPADSQAIFTPSGPSDRVLEIKAGLVDKLGIKVGDLVDQID